LQRFTAAVKGSFFPSEKQAGD
jgi:hypothetical protein